MSTSSEASDALLPAGAANGRPAENGHVELDSMASKPALPVEEDIMQLARLGELGAIQKLFDTGKFDATYTDDQDITPLHWAAINNHYALCQFLIQSGANVNAKGGDAVATPLLWASKRCHYYIVDLLLQHGADPLLTDDQGFNLLHSATLDGNVFQLALLLHQDIPVDIPDAQGHTALMWAAYKGYPACVNLFLRWGASVRATDDMGFTALHWALVKGSLGSIQKLVEYGADRFAQNNEGKTPATTAGEMSTEQQWHTALRDSGYNKDGSPREFPIPGISDTWTFFSRLIFFWPFPLILFSVYALSRTAVYIAIPLIVSVVYGAQFALQKLLRWAPKRLRSLHNTPLMAGIFSGTLFWVGVQWVLTVLPWTLRHHILYNVLFAACYSLTAYFYFLSMAIDPGYVPKSATRSSEKALIEELMEARQFDEKHFCIKCMVRKPLRSRHCNRCERCVAKSDHHCPWVNNCVANNNHRHFLLYVVSMSSGISLWVRLVALYLAQVPESKEGTCHIINEHLCNVLEKDPFTVILTGWTALQLVWVAMLLCSQLVQIARGLTTFESMRGHLHDHTPTEALNTFVTTGDTSQETSSGAGFGSGQDAGVAHKHHHHHAKRTLWQQWKQLLGVDIFMATAFGGSSGSQPALRRGNPFSRGVVTNCKDFWCDGAPLFKQKESGFARIGGERIDYTRLYEVPKMRMRRQGERYEAVADEEAA